MRILVDTHVLLWWLSEPERLNPEAHAALAGAGNEVFWSAVSAWEIVVKTALGKLEVPANLAAVLASARFRPLDLRPAHAWRLRELPPLHTDPFDRMLAAQALAEQLTLVTRDERLLQYPILTLRA